MAQTEDFNLTDDLILKIGKLHANAAILQAIVDVALDTAELDDVGRLKLTDGGSAALLLISAFFFEEYDFRVAQLKREAEEVKTKLVGSDGNEYEV